MFSEDLFVVLDDPKTSKENKDNKNNSDRHKEHGTKRYKHSLVFLQFISSFRCLGKNKFHIFKSRMDI